MKEGANWQDCKVENVLFHVHFPYNELRVSGFEFELL